MRELRTYGKSVMVEIEMYSECKYTASAEAFENAKRIQYEIESWEIVTDDAIEIGKETDENSRDDYNEYLVLNLVGGETATFRNSYVDMFKI